MVDRLEVTLYEEILPLEADGLISAKATKLAANQAESHAAMVQCCIYHLWPNAWRLMGRIAKTQGSCSLDCTSPSTIGMVYS
jgi:hypothetical protein